MDGYRIANGAKPVSIGEYIRKTSGAEPTEQELIALVEDLTDAEIAQLPAEMQAKLVRIKEVVKLRKK